MKKNTLIRNDSPHAVNMPEGSHLAAHKTRKAPGTPVPEEKPPKATAVRKPVSQKSSAPTPNPVPPSIAVKSRGKARLRPKAAVIAAPVLPSHAPASVPVASALPAKPVDEAVVWEKDNPVKTRLAQLQARNALLQEQLQRLKSTFQARGKKP